MQTSDHFREAAIGTVRGVGEAKVFEYLDEIVSCPGWQPFKGCTTATRVGNRRGKQFCQLDLTSKMDLGNLTIGGCPCEMACALFVKEQMKDCAVKSRILRMAMPLPIRDVHVEFDVAFEDLPAVDSY